MTIPVNTVVYLKNDKSKRGVVIKNNLKLHNYVAIEWSDGIISSHLESALITESLHTEYEKYKTVVQAKISQAADLLKEANEIKTKNKIEPYDLNSFSLKTQLTKLGINLEQDSWDDSDERWDSSSC